jgi:hypothetical protein
MVDALEQTVDSITISFDPWNGSTGYMFMFYALHGTNSATGTDARATFGPHGVPYACVKLGLNAPLFPFGCTAYDQPGVDGTFFAGMFPFTYGAAFPLWFQLESIAGTGFGPGRPSGLGTSVTNFYNTATIDGLLLLDPNMHPLSGTPNITSTLGISYQVLFMAREVKAVQRARLMARLPTGDRQVDDELDEAIRRIDASLSPNLWADDLSHLTPDGERVFDEERKAVDELSEIRGVPALLEQLRDTARTLASVDRALAQRALDEARLAGAEAEDLARAKEDLIRADNLAGQGRFGDAIEQYKHAWRHAQEAIHRDTDDDGPDRHEH